MINIYAADHVIPVATPPIRYGAVATDGEAIIAVGTADALQASYPEAPMTNYGRAAILPGLVNCHSHLEITAMRGRLDSVEHDFRTWLLTLNSIRQSMTDDEVYASAAAGAIEGARAGVTCFGDVGRSGEAGFRALKDAGLRGIVFQETEFSPDNRTANEDFAVLAARFEAMHSMSDALVRVGLSPHSPYTVSSQLFELIAQYSIINRIPISIHAAESDHEVELMTKGTGFFTEVYDKFDVEWQSPYSTPIEYLERLGVLAARPILAHCVKASPDDLRRIEANGASIAHCPRSNAKFGHGWAPFEMMLDMGIKVGLGSDSVASNNQCDIMSEAAFATLGARNRDGSMRFIDAEEAIRAATLGGAEALGLADSIGSLEAGKRADLAVFSLDHPAQQPLSDIHAALVFSTNARDAMATIVAGKVIYSAA
jgi:cytosine/adenosine deaminase-related metal-dependent hydrolase